MIFRAGFLLVALVSAITVVQTNLFRARKRSPSSHSSSKHGNASFHGGRHGKEDSRFDASNVERREEEEKAETCRSESVLEEISDKPETIDCKMEISTVQENSVHEINHLKKVVKEMEQRRENLELGLIELYCFKEQKSRISKLHEELKDKMAEIDILNNMLNKLQSEREELYKEVKLNQLTEKQLQSARLTILELQLKMEFDAGRLNEHLVRLKEQVWSSFDRDETLRKDTKSDQKLKDIRKIELEAVKMKRRNKELQLEKRELGVKLDIVQARISENSSMTQDIIVARIEDETNRLKGDNHHLSEKVEELHKNRFSILEELVYQRRLNSCLRFEVQDHYSPQPRKTCRKLCFQSEDDSKTTSLDPGSELSSTDSDEIANTTIDSCCSSTSSSPSVKSKKNFSTIFNIKRWGGGRSSNDSSPDVKTRSFGRKPGLLRRFSMSSVPSSSTSGQRNKGGRNPISSSSSPETPLILRNRVRRVSFNDSLNSVLAYTSDDYSPISVQEMENNHQNTAENYRDWSGIKTSSSLASTTNTIHEKKTEMMASEPKVSGDLNINRDSHSINNEIKTEIQLNKDIIVSTECLSPGKPNVSPGARKFREQAVVNLIVAFSVIVFLFFNCLFQYSSLWK